MPLVRLFDQRDMTYDNVRSRRLVAYFTLCLETLLQNINAATYKRRAALETLKENEE